MIFNSSRSTSTTLFRNLHTAANRARRQSSEAWLRATVSLAAPAKRQVKEPTWRGSRALGGASHEIVGAVQEESFANCA